LWGVNITGQGGSASPEYPFDTNLSFVTRGLLFVAAGLGFFVLNYRMLKKRKDEN